MANTDLDGGRSDVDGVSLTASRSLLALVIVSLGTSRDDGGDGNGDEEEEEEDEDVDASVATAARLLTARTATTAATMAAHARAEELARVDREGLDCIDALRRELAGVESRQRMAENALAGARREEAEA